MMRRLVIVVGCALAAPAAAAPEVARHPPTRLLAAPSFRTGPRAFAAFAGSGAAVNVAWVPQPQATGYRATWTDDTGLAADFVLDASAFTRDRVAPGHYQLSVTAIDSAGIEGVIAPALPIEVVEIRATPPGAAAPAAPTRGGYAIGTRIAAAGMKCQLGDGAPADEVRATAAGAFALVCASPFVTVATRVVIAPVAVATTVPSIARGATTVVHVTVTSVAALGDRLDLVELGDVAFGDAHRTDRGFDVPITVATYAKSAGVIVRAGGHELGRAPIALVDGPPVVASSVLDWWALDVGAYGGALFPRAHGRSASIIGEPSDPSDATTTCSLVGARIGVFPTRRVGIESEVAFATGDTVGHAGTSSLLATRAQLAVRAYASGRFGLRVVAGAGAITTLHDHGTASRGTIGELHAGVAFEIMTLTPGLSIRLQAVDVVTTARDAGFAHDAEVQLGVVMRLGRRDRW